MIAINRIEDDNLLASCITFLEFAGFDTRIIKIDIKVLKRIIKNLKDKNKNDYNKSIKKVKNEFLNIP